MKKLVIILSIFLCFLFSYSVSASDGAITLEAQQIENEIVLTFNVTENSGLCTTEIYVDFAQDVLEFKAGSQAIGAAAAELSPYVTANIANDGRLKISYTCTEPLTTGGEICCVSFKPKKDAAVQFTPEIEHAETFDGKNILSLEFTAECCTIVAEKSSSSAVVFIAAGAAIIIAAAISVPAIKKRKV